MGKLLIAVRSDILAANITRAMPKGWEICTCFDGNAATDILKTQKPDALIIELRLPCKDGLAVLKDCFPDLPQAILALTDFDPPYSINAATSYGAASVIQIPTQTRTIVDRITDIASSLVTPPSVLSRHLDTMGINKEYDGYRGLLTAIPAIKANPALRLHKEVYPLVMEACNLTDQRCVERSIRFAIKKAWEQRDEAVWAHYFPTEKYGDKCPNNQTFIRCLAEWI